MPADPTIPSSQVEWYPHLDCTSKLLSPIDGREPGDVPIEQTRAARPCTQVQSRFGYPMPAFGRTVGTGISVNAHSAGSKVFGSIDRIYGIFSPPAKESFHASPITRP
jgi:hypothetical protein